MDIERTLIRGPNGFEHYFCGHCRRLAVDPRAHSGGYEQFFCQEIFCLSCTTALQNLDINPNFHVDHQGRRRPRCPTAGCFKDFVPPYFRFMSSSEVREYRSIIIECAGCHHEFDPFDYCSHRITCVALRDVHNWVPNEIIHNPPPRIPNLAARRRAILEQYESRWRVLSVGTNSEVIGASMNGTENIVRVFMPSGNEWSTRQLSVMDNREAFLARVGETFRVEADGDILALSHRALSAYPDVRSFLRGLPVGTPLVFCNRRQSLASASSFGSWLFLGPVPVNNFDLPRAAAAAPDVIIP
uniref:Uncharacterized protein n=1 Tax=Tetranychus urticae TaxID=32264 RepID=T1KRM1_TETUR